MVIVKKDLFEISFDSFSVAPRFTYKASLKIAGEYNSHPSSKEFLFLASGYYY